MTDESNQAVVEVEGESPTEGDRFWVETAQKLTAESVISLEEGAKQIITTAAILMGIYFTALTATSFSDNLAKMDFFAYWNKIFILMLIIPPLLWFFSLILAIMVFNPRRYPTNWLSPDVCKISVMEMIKDKHRYLRIARISLALAFLPLIACTIVYFRYIRFV